MISYIMLKSIVFDELNPSLIFKHSHSQTVADPVFHVGGNGSGNQHFCTNDLHDVEWFPPANEVCEGYGFTPVCHSVHREGCLVPGVPGLGGAWSRGCLVWGVPGPGRVSGPGRVPGPGGCGDRPGRLLLRAVLILLECILVL